MTVVIKLMPNLEYTQKMLPFKKGELNYNHFNPVK